MRHYIFIILLQVCCYSCAQQKISINQLIGTKWTIESSQDVKRTIEFHKDYYTEIAYVAFLGDTISSKREYYLSNEIPTVFDKKQKSKNKGMYIVGRTESHEHMWYYTIISFTTQKMVLFEKAPELKEGEIAIGGQPHDITWILERIEE